MSSDESDASCDVTQWLSCIVGNVGAKSCIAFLMGCNTLLLWLLLPHSQQEGPGSTQPPELMLVKYTHAEPQILLMLQVHLCLGLIF